MKTAVILGPGALGTVLAFSLKKAGLDVSLLARDARSAAAIRKQGLRLDGKPLRGLPVSHKAADLAPPDLLVLCVKHADLRAALASARRLAGRGTTVLALQNGVAHLGPFRRAFGDRGLFGAAFLGATRGPDGVRLLGRPFVAVASRPGKEAQARALARLLKKGGLDARVQAGEESLLWTKTLLNAAINPLAALVSVPNGDLVTRPPLKELLLRAAAEGQSLARRQGLKLLTPDLGKAALKLCRDTAANRNSMAQDLDARRPTEAPAILDPVLALSKRPETEAPVLWGLRGFLRGVEQGLRKEGR